MILCFHLLQDLEGGQLGGGTDRARLAMGTELLQDPCVCSLYRPTYLGLCLKNYIIMFKKTPINGG